MTAKLKMWTGNFDGRREGLVIAPSKQRASKIVGCGLTDFNRHWREQPIDESLEAEVFYTRPFNNRMRPSDQRDPWFRGRCPL